MKLRLAVLLLGFLIGSSTQVRAQAMGHGHGVTTTFVYNNLSFRYSFGDEDFKDTPSWNPETEDSPISSRKALDVARITLHRFVSDAAAFEVEKISLERFEPHKWVFEISFHCWDNRCSDTAVSFTVFVKMDGVAIEPEVTPKQKDASNGATQQIVGPERGSRVL
jgi:hypothetical protein